MIKLNLGCSTRRLPGYVNVDCQPAEAVDVVMDLKEIDKHYEEGTVDVIYISHVLEHFPRHEARDLIKKLYTILKKGGVLRIAVPNFESVVIRYTLTLDLDELHGLLYSNHDVPFDGHYTIWDFRTMSRDLKNVGFDEIKSYDWRMTDHSTIDDYSQAYLPHMNKETGLLMSLNVEATK